MEYVKLFLPIGWVIVSTVVGVILYRTSDAFFEKVSKDKSSRQQLKLTGSVVIAALTFLGMYYVTPRGALTPKPEGMQYVASVEVQRLLDRVHDVQDRLLALSACLSVSSPKDCSGQLQDAQTSATSLEQQARRVDTQADLSQ
jgi:hypothetical protein